MGWKAIYKDGTMVEEGTHGRPVQAGDEGLLSAIIQEDFGHRILIDLVNGVIFVDTDEITVQNGTVEISSPKTVLFVCDETNIIAELFDIENGEPDEEGWFSQTIIPIQWRPIWFTRNTSGIITKVIGLQATLPENYGGKNVKKMVSLFEDGRIGIA